MPLQGKISVAASFQESLTQALSTNLSDTTLRKLHEFLDGAGAGQANRKFVASRSIAQSVNDDLDLSGTLAGTYGTVVFTAVKLLLVVAGEANPGVLTMGNALNPFIGWFGAGTMTHVLEPGGVYLASTRSAAGRAVTGGTGDILRHSSAATAGTYTYDILVIGIG